MVNTILMKMKNLHRKYTSDHYLWQDVLAILKGKFLPWCSVFTANSTVRFSKRKEAHIYPPVDTGLMRIDQEAQRFSGADCIMLLSLSISWAIILLPGVPRHTHQASVYAKQFLIASILELCASAAMPTAELWTNFRQLWLAVQWHLGFISKLLDSWQVAGDVNV